LGKNQSIPLLQVNTTEAVPGVETINSIVYRDIYRNSLLAVNSLQAKNESYTIQPNPTTDQSKLMVLLEKPAMIHASIYDLSGKLVHVIQQMGVPGMNQLTLSGVMLSSGIYRVSLDADKQFIGVKSWVIAGNR
jgi:hypothetical protein